MFALGRERERWGEVSGGKAPNPGSSSLQTLIFSPFFYFESFRFLVRDFHTFWKSRVSNLGSRVLSLLSSHALSFPSRPLGNPSGDLFITLWHLSFPFTVSLCYVNRDNRTWKTWPPRGSLFSYSKPWRILFLFSIVAVPILRLFYF